MEFDRFIPRAIMPEDAVSVNGQQRRLAGIKDGRFSQWGCRILQLDIFRVWKDNPTHSLGFIPPRSGHDHFLLES
jgi:hypothetical protein